jgi:EAL domain-containing protein (putative c-di-GMP-specific phosphodiesterase class I)
MRGFDRLGFRTPLELLDKSHAVDQLLDLEQMINSRAFTGFCNLHGFTQRMLFINMDTRLIGLGGSVVERLTNHLAKTGIRPSFLCFELSERFDNASIRSWPNSSGSCAVRVSNLQSTISASDLAV